MKLQDMIRAKKEIIINLFCTLYGQEYYERFSILFDRVIFLFPTLYEEDKQQYLNELSQNYYTSPLSKSDLLERLQDKDCYATFIPMLQKKQEGIYQGTNFIVFSLANQTYLNQNLDTILLHELKHLFTYHVMIFSSSIITKVGVSCVEERYINGIPETMSAHFQIINEVLTEFDAEYLTALLHETTEIFPGEQAKPMIPYWYQDYFPLITSLSRKDQSLLRQIELDPDFSKMELLSDADLIGRLELATFPPFPKRKQKKKQFSYFDKNKKK